MVRPKPIFPKQRNNAPVVRSSAFKKPRERILIVCEDSVSGSCSYFHGLVKQEELGSIVTIDHQYSHGRNTPTKIYKRAQAAYEKDCKKQNDAKIDAYDKVYCVFDKDHNSLETISSALSLIQNHPSGKFQAIPSYPCFEVWILLHYAYTSASLSNYKEVEERIKKYLPDYSKTNPIYKNDLYKKIKDSKANTATAIKNAKKTRAENKTLTDIDIVVEHLLKLANANL